MTIGESISQLNERRYVADIRRVQRLPQNEMWRATLLMELTEVETDSCKIFKYSGKAKRYLPANPQFAEHLLADIENQKQSVPPPGDAVSQMNHVGDVLSIVLDYVFAGREREAWTFYDQAYKLPDKRRIKRQIKALLSDSPVYRFIYFNKVPHRKV